MRCPKCNGTRCHLQEPAHTGFLPRWVCFQCWHSWRANGAWVAPAKEDEK